VETKQCPFCAETIKRTAKLCRFCGYDLHTGKPAVRGFPLSLRHAILVVLVLAIFAGGYIGYRVWKDKQIAIAAAKAAEDKKKADAEAARVAAKAEEEKKRAEEKAEAKAAEEEKRAEEKAAEERKKADSLAKIIQASETATSKIHEMDSALVVGINYEHYSQKLTDLAGPIDALVRVISIETKQYPNEDADKLCKVVVASLANYKNARDLWHYEIYGKSEDPDIIKHDLVGSGPWYDAQTNWIHKAAVAAADRQTLWLQAAREVKEADEISRHLKGGTTK